MAMWEEQEQDLNENTEEEVAGERNTEGDPTVCTS